MRLLLAIRCFFLVLFAARLPDDALALLPPPPEPEPPKLPPGPTEAERAAEQRARAAEERLKAAEEAAKVAEKLAAEKAAEADRARVEAVERGAVLMLGLLQREGRLVDFLEEDVASYTDAQIGAAVRDIHKGCKKALAEHMDVKPVLGDADGATVKVDAGFDPSRVKLIGNVVGAPPFTGVLKHPGWRGATVKLPDLPSSYDPTVIAPAEVELS